MVDRDSQSDSSGSSSVPDELKLIFEFVKRNPILLVGVVLVGVIGWVFRPYLQPFYYNLAFKSIGTVLYAVVTVVFWIAGKIAFEKEKKRVGYAIGAITIVLLVMTLVSPIAAQVYVNEDLSERTNTNTPETSNFSEAPSVDDENIRTLTFKGAETQAQTSFNEPTHTLTDGELVMRDGQLSTSYAMQPEGLYKTFTRNQKGAVFVNINSQQPSVEQVNQEFKCGRGMLIFDDVKYKMQKDHMNTRLTNPTTFQAGDGNLYNMYSGIQRSDYRFGFKNGIPMVYTVPEYSGIYLSDTECNQEHLTPSEAVQDSRLNGENKQQFYPYGLLRKEVIATNLQNGWINTITDKEGMKEFPNTPSIDNRPPYTMMMEDGTYRQVLTMEAIGGGSGVFEVYIGNGRTGEKTKYTFDSTKKGPGYAVDSTITADSERYGSGDKLTVSEVYPVFRDGNLWYQINAVQSNTGVYGYTAFYSPDEGTLLKAYTDSQVQAFYQGSNETHNRPENVIDDSDPQSNTRNVDNPTLWVVIENNDGDDYTVPVAGNESVSVEQETPENESE